MRVAAHQGSRPKAASSSAAPVGTGLGCRRLAPCWLRRVPAAARSRLAVIPSRSNLVDASARKPVAGHLVLRVAELVQRGIVEQLLWVVAGRRFPGFGIGQRHGVTRERFPGATPKVTPARIRLPPYASGHSRNVRGAGSEVLCGFQNVGGCRRRRC